MLDPDRIGSHFSFDLVYTPTVMSGAVYRWRWDWLRNGNPFEVSASRDGVVVQGPCPSLKATTDLRRVLALAGCVHRLLAMHDDRAGIDPHLERLAEWARTSEEPDPNDPAHA